MRASGVAAGFEFVELSDDELSLQAEVREFLAAELPRGSFEPGLGMAAESDQAFSRKLAARGWLGMALPRAYGGQDRAAVDRFVVTEELLRWGAPVGYHWIADRQTGPVIARFGSEQLKQRFLPAICAADVSFSIGMSEPEAGSDLASVKTRAERVDGGWIVSGTKIWTGGAHVNDWAVVLCRTGEGERHAGLSQLIVDLHADGLEARPIAYMDGSEFFCEVTLDQVFVPDEMVLGELGEGWAQNASELAFERAGPERWLSTYLVIEEFLRAQDPEELGAGVAAALGDAIASWWGLRALSLSVARAIDRGDSPAAEAALVKELGTRFEQDVLDVFWRLAGERVDRDSPFGALLQRAILGAPALTIRGGTNEILRTVAAKSLRQSTAAPSGPASGSPAAPNSARGLGDELLDGALARVVEMAGALERVTAMSIDYANEREQFGRPIASFQSVQTLLVVIAQQAALVRVACDAAIARGGAFEIGAAKLLANRAAITAGRAAHQVHGARGTTLEHALPVETRRLWAWRDEYGDERHWAERLGTAVAQAGADGLYPAITAGSRELSV